MFHQPHQYSPAQWIELSGVVYEHLGGGVVDTINEL